MRVGVFGGTFDPVHLGHLIAAEETRIKAELDEVWFMPCYKNWMKRKCIASPEHRAKMIELALKGFKKLKLSTIGLKEKSPYVIDIVKKLKVLYPKYDFFWIIGSDLVEQFDEWKNAKDILKEIKLIVIERAGFEKLKQGIVLKSKPLIVHCTLITNLSSSEVRKRFKVKKPVKHLLDKKVFNYILKNEIYG